MGAKDEGALAPVPTYLSEASSTWRCSIIAASGGSGLKDAKNFVGAYHFGFQVEGIAATQKLIEAAGGQFCFDLGDDPDEENFERKFKDPDGIIFDIPRERFVPERRDDGYIIAIRKRCAADSV